MKISASGYVVIILIAGFVLVGYLFATSPDSAPQQLPLIFTIIGGIVTLLLKQGDTDAQLAKAKEAAVAGIVASEQNAAVLAAVDQKVAVVKGDVATNTAITAEANKQIRELKITVDGRLERLLVQTAIASNLSGQQQGAQDERDRAAAAAPPPAEPGSTPAHGTTIQPAGPTTIIVDSITPTTIVRPGDQH